MTYNRKDTAADSFLEVFSQERAGGKGDEAFGNLPAAAEAVGKTEERAFLRLEDLPQTWFVVGSHRGGIQKLRRFKHGWGDS